MKKYLLSLFGVVFTVGGVSLVLLYALVDPLEPYTKKDLAFILVLGVVLSLLGALMLYFRLRLRPRKDRTGPRSEERDVLPDRPNDPNQTAGNEGKETVEDDPEAVKTVDRA